MINYQFTTQVSKDFLENELMFEFGQDYKGEGIYKIFSGSRGMIEEVTKISDGNSYNLKTTEELVEDLYSNFSEEEIEAFEEFIFSGEEKQNGVVWWEEGLSEEEHLRYYWVK